MDRSRGPRLDGAVCPRGHAGRGGAGIGEGLTATWNLRPASARCSHSSPTRVRSSSTITGIRGPISLRSRRASPSTIAAERRRARRADRSAAAQRSGDDRRGARRPPGRRLRRHDQPASRRQPVGSRDRAPRGARARSAATSDWQPSRCRDAAAALGTAGVEVTMTPPPRRERSWPGDSRPRSVPRRRPGIAVEMLTSGTTGPPKRVPLSVRVVRTDHSPPPARTTAATARATTHRGCAPGSPSWRRHWCTCPASSARC